MAFKEYKDTLNISLNLVDEQKLDNIIKFIRDHRSYLHIHTCGNGGSFSIAQHFAQDLYKAATLFSTCLGSNSSLVTAIANDKKYSDIFLEDFYNSLNEGAENIVIIFSCSGNSKNVVKLAEYCRKEEYTVISFTGCDGGKVAKLSDINITIPVENYGIIESVFSVLCHYIVERLKV